MAYLAKTTKIDIKLARDIGLALIAGAVFYFVFLCAYQYKMEQKAEIVKQHVRNGGYNFLCLISVYQNEKKNSIERGKPNPLNDVFIQYAVKPFTDKKIILNFSDELNDFKVSTNFVLDKKIVQKLFSVEKIPYCMNISRSSRSRE